jgi:hypothetical protein
VKKKTSRCILEFFRCKHWWSSMPQNYRSLTIHHWVYSWKCQKCSGDYMSFFELEKRRAISPSSWKNSDFPTEIVHCSRATLCNLYLWLLLCWSHRIRVVCVQLVCVGRGCWSHCIENHTIYFILRFSGVGIFFYPYLYVPKYFSVE